MVHHAVERHASRAPGSIAVTCDRTTLTFAELDAGANRLAHLMARSGVGPGSIVGVCLDRTPCLVVAVLAVLKAGAAYVPLDPTYPQSRLEVMLGQLDRLAVVLAEQDTVSLVADAPCELLVLDDPQVVEAAAAERGDAPDVAIGNDDLCYVVFTSGSTGVPKAAAVRHSGWYNLLEWLRVEYGLDEGSSGLTVSSFGFDISQRGLMAPLFVGAATHLLPSRYFDPAMALRLIRTHGVRQLHLAPSTLYALVEQEQATGSSVLTELGHAFIGGEPLTFARIAAWAIRADNTCTLLHQYGVAECTDVATSFRLDRDAGYGSRVLPVGRPVYNTEIRVLDENLDEVADGTNGEIAILGAGICAGYVNGASTDTRRFTRLPETAGSLPVYLTGDRGHLDADGELVVIGRADTQVKIRGMRMDLGDVEHGLRDHASVDDAVVLALPDQDGEQSLVAFVLSVDGSANPAALQRGLVRKLPRTMIPQRVTVLTSFPLGLNGKIDRRALAALVTS
jgi:amino acid adenylation domain-containing protein